MNTPRKILKGFFYAVGGGYAARLGSVVLTLFLKREVGPSAMDAVLTGWLYFFMLSSLREFHLLQGLLHYQDRVEEFVRTHFTLNLIIVSLWCLLTCGVALGLWLWGDGDMGWTAGVLCFFAVFHWLRNLTLTSEALLRMDFEYGRLSLFHGLGTLLALGCALAAAKGGWGEWSLLLGGWSSNAVFSLVYVLFFVGAVWWARPLKVWPLQLDREWTCRLLRYGTPLWAGWVVQNFVWYYDKLIVRHLVGENALTHYENAWWLMQIPTAMITHIVFTYTNTLYARYRDDRARLSEFFGRMMALIVRVSAPIALLFVLNAADIVAVMGPEWMPSAPILVWLAAYAFLRPLIDDGYNLLMAVGASRTGGLVMLSPAVAALVIVPLAVGYWDGGVQGAAYSMGGVAAVGVLAVGLGVRRYVDVPWVGVFGAPLAALGLAVACSQVLVRDPTGLVWVDLLWRSGLVVVVYGGTLALLERRTIAALASQVRRVMGGG